MSKRTIILVLGVVAALVVGVGVAFAASLPGSNFEIDTDANLKVDNAAPSIDWLNSGANTLRSGVTVKPDLASGSGDNSFGNGTKEDTPVPSVVSGSIPPNKSDLLNFGVYLETTSSGARFLNVFWHRVQEPSGTTNMDFELNKSSTLSGNGVTPVRTAGDLLIQYDLANGGTNPQLFLSRWVTTGNPAQDCQASNSLPCWGTRVNLSAAGDATGSINTSPIPSTQADGLGNISARTFGEAQINFNALAGGTGQCTSFGSAYLKSRSSDSFTAALKDFIAPASVNIGNCAQVTIRKETNPEENPNTTNFGFTKSFPTQPATTNTFTLQDDGVKTYTNVVQGSNYTVDEDVIPAGWDLTNIDCNVAGHPSSGVTPTISVPNGTVTFSIDSASDVLDCTYTNRAKGTIVVEKITDDGTGTFDFTSNSLGGGTPQTPHTFQLTTTAAGAGGKDSETFSNLAPGTYDVAETVPAGWNLVSATCDSDLTQGDDASNPASIGLEDGETVTCTFHDAQQRGAILITKTRKHAADGPGDHPHAGVDFTVDGVTKTTDANGQACFDGLLFGDYTVHEVTPAGYSGEADKTVTVNNEASCSDDPYGGEEVSFSNTPLTDLSVTVDSQVAGGTDSQINCVNDAAPNTSIASHDTDATGDGTASASDLEPGNYTCKVVIDP